MKRRAINCAKRVSHGCRNNGPCEHCRGSRLYQARRAEQSAAEQQTATEEIAMSGITNEERAERARVAVQAHCDERGDSLEDSSITDLLADLMHFCDQDGGDFEHALDVARLSYVAEKEAGE